MSRLFACIALIFLLAACAAAEGVAAPTRLAQPTERAATGETVAPTETTAPTLTQPATETAETATSPTTEVALPLASSAPTETPRYGYRIIERYPHDDGAYTQGLVYYEGIFYESTGLYGESTLRKVALETGEVLQRHDLPQTVFAEGLALVDERLIQLTWQSNIGYIYDRESFTELDQFSYPTQGWGLAYDGEKLIMTDGSEMLYFRDPVTLEEIGSVRVTDQGEPVYRLNELEMVEGELFANVYQTDLIARIDPTTGNVVGWIDLSGLLAPEERTGNEDVLNGIAYDPGSGRLFVTGKRWPLLFEIELQPVE